MENSIETRGNLCTELGRPVFRPGIIHFGWTFEQLRFRRRTFHVPEPDA